MFPLEFWGEGNREETGVVGLSYSENRMIVASVVLTQCLRVTDRQTDKQTDGFTIAIYFTYRNRLAVTNLETLESRRLRADLVMCYKIVFRVINVDFGTFFRFVPSNIIGTRGHRYKLFVEQSNHNVRSVQFSSVQFIL